MTGNQIAFAVHNETKRSNLAREALGLKQLDETIRSNQAQESINWFNAYSSREHYERADAEVKRHNLSTESLTERYNQGLLNIQSASLSETKRHNAVTEQQGSTKLTQDYDIADRNISAKNAGTLAHVASTLGGILTGLGKGSIK